MKLIIIFTVLVVFASADIEPNSAAIRNLVKRQNSGTNFTCTPEEIENILTDECTDEYDVVTQTDDIFTDSAAIVALCDSGCLNQIGNVFQMCANLSDTNLVSFVCGRSDQGERCPSLIVAELNVTTITFDVPGNCFDEELRIPQVCRENCTQATFSDGIANLGCCTNYFRLPQVQNIAGEIFTFLDALTQCGVEVPGLCDIGLESPTISIVTRTPTSEQVPTPTSSDFSCTPEEIENILTDECTDEFDAFNQIDDIFTDSAAIVALCNSGCLNQIVNVFQMCANLSVTNLVSFICGRSDQGERCPSLIFATLSVGNSTFDVPGNCLDNELRIPLVCRENCTQATFSDGIANLGCCTNYFRLPGVQNTAGEIFTFLDALTQCGVEVPGLCDIGLELPATTSPPITTEPTMCAAVPTAAVLRFSVLSFLVVLVAAAIF